MEGNGQVTFSKYNGESGNINDSVDFFCDARGEGDYAVKEYSVQQRVVHFFCDRIDNCKNRQSVEICLLLEAGSSVSDEKATTSDLCNGLMMERYINLVHGFQLEDFIFLPARGNVNEAIQCQESYDWGSFVEEV
jgi:hypothetical protein